MNENQRNFFTTRYAEIPSKKIWIYSVVVVIAFGILGVMTGELSISLLGGSVAIGIPIFGRFLDYSRTNPPAIKLATILYTIIAYIFAFIVLACIVVPSIVKMLKQM